MSKLAVDVVLLPPQEIAEQAIAISTRLHEKENGPFKLGMDDYLPHITLGMGVLDENDLERAKAILKKISEETQPLPFSIKGLVVIESRLGGDYVSALTLDTTPGLLALFEQIVGRLAPLLSFDPTPEMFVQPETIKEVTLEFVANFQKKYEDRSEYHPHITLGRGKLAPLDAESKVGSEHKANTPGELLTGFTASTLALCQLGHLCTCRKILASFNLAP